MRKKRDIAAIILLLLLIAFVFNGGNYGFYLYILLFMYFAGRILFSVFTACYRRKNIKEVSSKVYLLKMTARLMGLFFITGSVIYAVTFSVIGYEHSALFNNAELILRSMICSLDMFMLDVDSNILDRLDSYPFLKGLIVVQAALSFACTITLLISLVYSRAKAYYILHRKAGITPAKNHLYIFFGMNENGSRLASDIRRNDSAAMILFVETADINDENSGSWDNIVHLFTHRQSTFDLAADSDALVAIASRRLADVSLSDGSDSSRSDVLTYIGLERVSELIRSLAAFPGNAQLNIFFLSEDEDNNIRELIAIAKDKTVLDICADKGVKNHFSVHARYNGPNRVVEDLAVSKNMNVELLDSSHLAVEILKSVPENQPVRVAHLSSVYPAAVTRPLDSLIIGFGEVGRDAFRFIYEFGTFIQFNEGKPAAVTPRITAVDSRMDVLDGLFKANTPNVRYGEDLSLLNMDYNNYRFYSEVLSESRCRSLNYIVIALGDDEQNISLATAIFNRIRRFREDMSHLIILVRVVKEDKYELMRKVADHFNNGCGKKNQNIIRLFGAPSEIYTYCNVVRDNLTIMGRRFQRNYIEIKGEGDNWDTRREKLTCVPPQIDSLRKLRRSENQDLANALHASTKMWLLEQSVGDDFDWDDFYSRYFYDNGAVRSVGTGKGITYPELSERENDIILTLAMLEHARWNSAHEMLGYKANIKKAECNEQRWLHNCLIDWSKLDAESERASTETWKCDYKKYDFCVVDTTIALKKNN